MVKTSERGQILLVVVLTMIVALTVGLSIASRTITELKLSKQNEESQRAFQAAEAGIEQAIQNQGQPSVSGEFANNSQYSTTLTIDNGSTLILNNGQEVDQVSGSDIWLTTYPDFSYPGGLNFSGSVNVTFYFGTSEQNTCSSGGGQAVLPGIEVAWLEGTVATPTFKKVIMEPTICSRIPGAGVVKAAAQSNTISGTQFAYAATVQVTGGLIMKVIPIYNSAKIGVRSSGPAFPSQGSIIESTGTSGDTVRKVVYYHSYPQLPIEIFPYSIISQ